MNHNKYNKYLSSFKKLLLLLSTTHKNSNNKNCTQTMNWDKMCIQDIS
jgi:hypothetical protein